MFWVEKAWVSGNPLREDPRLGVGQVLCSPAKSQTGADVYHFMREVASGDVVFHIVDSKGIVGVSCVAAPAQIARRGNEDWYIVKLCGFKPLKPMLTREAFLGPEVVPKLSALLENGLKNTFFSKAMTLRQGAYLTPMPSELFEVLREADMRAHNRDLQAVVDTVTAGAISAPGESARPSTLP